MWRIVHFVVGFRLGGRRGVCEGSGRGRQRFKTFVVCELVTRSASSARNFVAIFDGVGTVFLVGDVVLILVLVLVRTWYAFLVISYYCC